MGNGASRRDDAHGGSCVCSIVYAVALSVRLTRGRGSVHDETLKA